MGAKEFANKINNRVYRIIVSYEPARNKWYGTNLMEKLEIDIAKIDEKEVIEKGVFDGYGCEIGYELKLLWNSSFNSCKQHIENDLGAFSDLDGKKPAKKGYIICVNVYRNIKKTKEFVENELKELSHKLNHISNVTIIYIESYKTKGHKALVVKK